MTHDWRIQYRRSCSVSRQDEYVYACSRCGEETVRFVGWDLSVIGAAWAKVPLPGECSAQEALPL